jgi:hypothetical protein
MTNRFRVVLMVLLMTVAGFQPAAGQKEDPKNQGTKKGFPQAIQWDTKDFEKALESELKAKVTSWSLVDDVKGPSVAAPGKHIKLVLEYVKDPDRNEPGRTMALFSRADPKSYSGHIEVKCFDDENVCIATLSSTNGGFTQGDLPRKKGEAFRGFIPLPDGFAIDKTKRIDVQLRLPPPPILILPPSRN